jgi:hypothetical protein
VEESAEQVASTYGALIILAEDGQPGGRIWWLQPERSVGTVAVVMLDVDPKDLLEVAAAHDQQPVQALGTDSAHPALRVGVGLGRPDWGHQDFGVLRPEHVVEAAGELRVVVAEQEADLSSSLPTASNRLRACWVTQRPLGLAVTPPRCTRRVSSSIKNST